MSNMGKKLTLVLSIFVVVSFGLKAAQKIGVVNMNKIFTSYYKTKLEDAKIKKQSDIYRKYLVSLNTAKDKLNTEFIKLRDATQNIAYSDTERENSRIEAQNKYRQLQAKEAEIQQYNTDKKKQLFTRYEKIRKALLEEIIKIVKSKGKTPKPNSRLRYFGQHTKQYSDCHIL